MDFIGLEKNELKPVAEGLNQLLAELHVHYQKLKNFHWNIQGNHFFELHNKFEEMYRDTSEKIDEVAERILIIQYAPLNTLRQYLEIAQIREMRDALSAEGMVHEILRDIGLLIPLLREIISNAAGAGDEGTVDLMSGYLKDAEKIGWMLNAYLGKLTVSKTDLKEKGEY